MFADGLWSLRRPFSIELASLATVFAGWCCLALVLPFPLLAAATLVWLLWRRQAKCSRAERLGARLVLKDSAWALHGRSRTEGLRLVHVWRTSSWITLRFREGDAPGGAGTRSVTVWRACNPAEAWRRLNLIIAARSSLPMPTSTQGAQ